MGVVDVYEFIEAQIGSQLKFTKCRQNYYVPKYMYQIAGKPTETFSLKFIFILRSEPFHHRIPLVDFSVHYIEIFRICSYNLGFT